MATRGPVRAGGNRDQADRRAPHESVDSRRGAVHARGDRLDVWPTSIWKRPAALSRSSDRECVARYAPRSARWQSDARTLRRPRASRRTWTTRSGGHSNELAPLPPRRSAEPPIPDADARRQRLTAAEILRRFDGQPGQILADEVGMGKTFVALAVAASVIENTDGRIRLW